MEANVIVVKTKRSYIVYIEIKRGNLLYRDFVGEYVLGGEQFSKFFQKTRLP